MTTKEIKSEIQSLLDKIPEVVLEDILSYLKEVETKSEDQITTSRNISKILHEEKELLEKLAQ